MAPILAGPIPSVDSTSGLVQPNPTDKDWEAPRAAFMKRLFTLHEDRGSPIRRVPVIGHKEMDVYALFYYVEMNGGFQQVVKNKRFKRIGRQLKLPSTVTNAGYILKGKYEQLVLPFVQVLRAQFFPSAYTTSRTSVTGPAPTDPKAKRRVSDPQTGSDKEAEAERHVVCQSCGQLLPCSRYHSHLGECCPTLYGLLYPDGSGTGAAPSVKPAPAQELTRYTYPNQLQHLSLSHMPRGVTKQAVQGIFAVFPHLQSLVMGPCSTLCQSMCCDGQLCQVYNVPPTLQKLVLKGVPRCMDALSVVSLWPTVADIQLHYEDEG
ncbi:hypothetical protein KIPB_008828 [Kipferlia bialata]|uniref:ARID domain-containing protein n=1 Tax=Kipferlia bialata TaxID=797122 RepID=A0A9K3GLS6_9EUKA|nr:hypothetical protein KIPB_008828 [Kipferlia bialata]|eukprot:g8828.t1